MRVAGLILLGWLSVGSLASLAHGQTAAPVDTIAEARRLRDAGNYSDAATLMAAYVDSHPEDAGSARFAALMMYWSKDFGRARAIYDEALEKHSNDVELRLEAARFFADLGERRRARGIVAPVALSAPQFISGTQGALTLLGTLKYWDGDLVGARALFIDAIRLDSTNAEARRQLREIELASAMWVTVAASVTHDDQPLNRIPSYAEVGWFANPVTPLSIRLASTTLGHEDVHEAVSVGEATVTTFVPSARMDASASFGFVDRTFTDQQTDWTAKASLGFRLPANLVIEGSYERAPYTNTSASLVTAVMAQTLAGTLRLRDSKGWLGEGSARRETFFDDNAIESGFAWVLAPVARRASGQMQVGYSFVAQSATFSRFIARPKDVVFPPGQAPTRVRGYYDPYYTPRNLRIHSALAAATVRPAATWSLSASAALGLSASDDAPVLFTTPARPPDVDVARTYYRRSFSPWKVDAALDSKLSDAVRLSLTAAHGRGAFYTYTSAGVHVTYTFIHAARRRADRY